jgi:glycogen operon protein
MHVDGFRFDLASILARDPLGKPLANPPILWDIESDPVLAGTKLIAEAWDAGGLYQVGSFIGDSWKEWNGKFRDDLRSFFRSEPGAIRRLADRILGSPEVFGHEGREAEQSINFVTCHDGFTLNDLVSYNQKHNEKNRECNRDGCDDNRSWNCGIEGPTDNSSIEKLRNRQVKNHLTVTLLALGIPMILMGDEIRRTQRGNNNAYSQDNEISWMDWNLLEKHSDVHRFVKLLAKRRLLRDLGPERERKTLQELIHSSVINWHGVKLNQPDWSDNSRSAALSIEIESEGIFFYWILNAYWESLTFELPKVDTEHYGAWRRWIDTGREMPDDIVDWQCAQPVASDLYEAGPRSTVILISDGTQNLKPGALPEG